MICEAMRSPQGNLFRTGIAVFACFVFAAATKAAELPDAPGKSTVQKVCSVCHPAQIVLGQAMNREQWGNLVSNMISRGAKGTDAEFSEIVDYLATNLPAKTKAASGSQTPQSKAKKASGGLLDQAGPSDKQIVDDASAARGKTLYIAQCVTCHGPRARGTDRGADLVRSLVVLHDRYGSQLGPFLTKGHPLQAGGTGRTLREAQIEDLSNFLHQQVDYTLRTGPFNSVLNVVTGDPKAGETYFNGAGHCNTCHSVTGDLAHIASKYDPPTLQLKMVFPQTVAFGRVKTSTAKKPVTVTVTLPSGESVSGALQEIDNFSVSLQDDSGQYRSFERGPGVTVVKHDPYAAHEELLDQYTDQDIHNLVAYLETLK